MASSKSIWSRGNSTAIDIAGNEGLRTGYIDSRLALDEERFSTFRIYNSLQLLQQKPSY